jgi:RNA polymerase sigma factor (sigma-70 family)
MLSSHDSSPLHGDDQTLALLSAGDPEGMLRLLTHHGAVVRSYLRRKFGEVLDHSRIDEVMSLAAVRAWQAAPRFDATKAGLRSWFAVIARNCALNLIAVQEQDLHIPTADFDSLVEGIANEATEVDRLRTIADVNRCIEKLPPMPRAVLRADRDAGRPTPAPVLAEQLHTTPTTIWSARMTGRRMLRRMLEQLGYHTNYFTKRSQDRLEKDEPKGKQS